MYSESYVKWLEALDCARAALMRDEHNAAADRSEHELRNVQQLVRRVQRAGGIMFLEQLANAYRQEAALLPSREVQAKKGRAVIEKGIKAGMWVQQAMNQGKVVHLIDDQYVQVKWLSQGRAFSDVKPAVVGADNLDVIVEPRLRAAQAASYSGLTRSRLYQLNDEGRFGGHKRDPFYVTPGELDALQQTERQGNGTRREDGV